MKATKIQWDTDGDKELLKELPTEMELPKELIDDEIDYEGIEDYLSNQTGFFLFGYVLEKE